MTTTTSIARFALLEARRARLPWLGGVLLLGCLAAAEFAAALALTDSAAYRAMLYAASARLALASLLALAMTQAVARDMADGLLALTLSRPVSRIDWYLGRLLAALVLAAACALAACLPLAWLAPRPAALAWGASLAAEFALVAGASLAAVVALGQAAAAVLAVGGFYLLSRAIDAIVLLGHGPLVDPAAPTGAMAARAVEIIAWFLPALGRHAQSAWLVGDTAPPMATVLGQLGSAAVYLVLLAAVGLIDFARREQRP